MRLCGHCGDRYADTDVHNCWVLMKTFNQELLPSPPYEFVPSRVPKTDAEWSAERDAEPDV